jgi:hypothetical protein
LVLIKYLRLVLQHREGIYWCPAPLRDQDQHSYKVRDVANVRRHVKQTRSVVSTDTTTVSSDVETIDVEDDEGDVQSENATTAPSPVKQAAKTPLPTPMA